MGKDMQERGARTRATSMVGAMVLDRAAQEQANYMPPVGKPAADTEKANAKANEGLGEVLAIRFMDCVKEQSGTLRRFLSNIADGDAHYRKGFRVTLVRRLKDMRAYVKAVKGTPDEAIYSASLRSAGVRVSEAVTFSKAVDAGFSPDMNQNYHALIAQSRVYLTKGEGVGPTRRKGRPATPFLDKLKKFLTENAKTTEQLHQAAEFAETLAKLRDTPAPL
jgi:hypothetical protein